MGTMMPNKNARRRGPFRAPLACRASYERWVGCVMGTCCQAGERNPGVGQAGGAGMQKRSGACWPELVLCQVVMVGGGDASLLTASAAGRDNGFGNEMKLGIDSRFGPHRLLTGKAS